jgi:flagellar protein FliO/FliZ
MTQSFISVVLFLAVLACLPWLVKWLQKKNALNAMSPSTQSRLISAVAVGPNQKIVTLEIGPEGSRHWLTVGVTSQNITLLHKDALPRAGVVEPTLRS